MRQCFVTRVNSIGAIDIDGNSVARLNAISRFCWRKGGKVVQVVFLMFQSYTRGLKDVGLPGRGGPVEFEVVVMLGEVAMMGSWIFRGVLIPM